jgi:hypothetical protein
VLYKQLCSFRKNKEKQRMLQDQKTQMTHSNNTIIEEVSEQQLHAITGGCLDCQAVARVAALQVNSRNQKAGKTDSASKSLFYADQAIGLEKLSVEASKTANAPVPAGKECCQHYQQHFEKFDSLFKEANWPERNY